MGDGPPPNNIPEKTAAYKPTLFVLERLNSSEFILLGFFRMF
jgi:hypothetical protein